MSITSRAVNTRVLLPEPVRSITSTLSMRLLPSGLAPAWLATWVRSSVMPPPDSTIMSMPLPPSMRASCATLPPLPMGFCSAVIMAWSMVKMSLPAPPYSTLAAVAVRLSSPAPATRVLTTPPSLCVSAASVPIQSTAVWLNAPVVLPKIT